jgi:uncharacterized membrane protein YvlD (DUF360 family)
MRPIIRHFIYTIAAMYLLQSYVHPFEFGGNPGKTFIVVALAITLIIHFCRPLLKIVSFPVGGFVYTILMVLVVGAGLYALESVLPQFSIVSFDLPESEFFGIILGGVRLEGFQALVFVSAFIALFIGFIGWLMG